MQDSLDDETNPKAKLRGNQQQQETAKRLVLSGYDIHPKAQSVPTRTLPRSGETGRPYSDRCLCEEGNGNYMKDRHPFGPFATVED